MHGTHVPSQLYITPPLSQGVKIGKKPRKGAEDVNVFGNLLNFQVSPVDFAKKNDEGVVLAEELVSSE